MLSMLSTRNRRKKEALPPPEKEKIRQMAEFGMDRKYKRHLYRCLGKCLRIATKRFVTK